MSYPTHERSWGFDVNQRFITTGDAIHEHRWLLWNLKRSLVSITNTKWTVRRSSDGAGNVSDSDLWAAHDNLIWAAQGSNHSWIVLQNTTIGCEFLIDLWGGSSNPNCISFWFSNMGFTLTAGTATTRPTATDEQGRDWHYGTGAYWTFGGTPPQVADYVLDVMTSADGKGTRWMVWFNNYVLFNGFIESLENPVANWTSPNYFQINQQALGGARYPFSKDGMMYNNVGWVMQGATKGNGYCTSEGYGNVGYLHDWLPFRNEISGKWDFSRVCVMSLSAGMRGVLGRIADFYTKPAPLPNAYSIPETGTRQWVVVGEFLVPWNGSELLTW